MGYKRLSTSYNYPYFIATVHVGFADVFKDTFACHTQATYDNTIHLSVRLLLVYIYI